MAYVEAHTELRNHPKTKRVARLLCIPPIHVVGHLLGLWWWCQDYARDGNLSGYSAVEIADAAEWTADPDAFVEALIGAGRDGEPGFLEIAADGALLVHDWVQYGGKLFKIREQGAKRQANWRARQRNEEVTPAPPSGDSDVTQPHNDSNALLTHHVTPSNAYREDKIREEETREDAPVAAVDPAYGQAIRAFENEIGLISPSIIEDMRETWDTLTSNATPDWWQLALSEAVAANKRSWRYVRGILTNCMAEGHPPGYRRNGRNGAPLASELPATGAPDMSWMDTPVATKARP